MDILNHYEMHVSKRKKYMKYSIVIRTLGNAGLKYQKLLTSIENLKIQPEEIVVVLPYGYEKPKEQLGNETFIYSPKGLMYQRIAGVKAAHNDYVLCLDDDLSFDSDFTERLIKPIVEGKCDVTIPPLPEILPSGFSAFKMWLLGSASPLLVGRNDWFLKIKGNTGYAYNKFYRRKKYPEYLRCQTAPCACLMIRKEAFLEIHYDDELWLEKQKGYAFGDDQVLFYKLYLNNKKTFCVTNARLIHLDAGASQGKINERREYASAFFRELFFDRFICKPENSSLKVFINTVHFNYTKHMYRLLLALISLVKKEYLVRYSCNKSGEKDGKHFIAQEEYKLLSSVLIDKHL